MCVTERVCVRVHAGAYNLTWVCEHVCMHDACHTERMCMHDACHTERMCMCVHVCAHGHVFMCMCVCQRTCVCVCMMRACMRVRLVSVLCIAHTRTNLSNQGHQVKSFLLYFKSACLRALFKGRFSRPFLTLR